MHVRARLLSAVQASDFLTGIEGTGSSHISGRLGNFLGLTGEPPFGSTRKLMTVTVSMTHWGLVPLVTHSKLYKALEDRRRNGLDEVIATEIAVCLKLHSLIRKGKLEFTCVTNVTLPTKGAVCTP